MPLLTAVDKRDWTWWLDLIAREGLPVATKLFTYWQRGGTPTKEEWQVLNDLAQETPESQLRKAAARNGIDQESPDFLALLQMLKDANLA